MLPLWTTVNQKGLVSSHQGSYSVALRGPWVWRRRQRSQSAGRWHVCTTRRYPNFGRSLRVNCPPDQRDALNQAADDLNQRLQDLKVRTRVTNTEQLVFIAALNISYELTQEKAKTRDYAASMEQRIRMLQQTIEQALLDQGRITEKRAKTLNNTFRFTMVK